MRGSYGALRTDAGARHSQHSNGEFELGENRAKYRDEIGGRQARRLPQRGISFPKLGDLAYRVAGLRHYLHRYFPSEGLQATRPDAPRSV